MEEKKSERTFLHDLSTPITTLQLNLENAIMCLEDGSGNVKRGLELLRNCQKQGQRIADMLRERKNLNNAAKEE